MKNPAPVKKKKGYVVSSSSLSVSHFRAPPFFLKKNSICFSGAKQGFWLIFLACDTMQIAVFSQTLMGLSYSSP